MAKPKSARVQLMDPFGKADWLRQQSLQHPGFSELIKPGSTRRRKGPFQSTWKPAHGKDNRTGHKQKNVPQVSLAEHVKLPVPVPADRVRAIEVQYPSREGQAEFRKAIISAYGQCAVTGCRVEEVLEAAHIIPYVDARSNIVTNGLCLRADIHKLYDRNLIQIEADGRVVVAPSVADDYQDMVRAVLVFPENPDLRPNPELLAVRHLYIATPEGLSR